MAAGEDSRSPDGDHPGILVKAEPQWTDASVEQGSRAAPGSPEMKSPFELTRERDSQMPALHSLPSVSTPSHLQLPSHLKLATGKAQAREEKDFPMSSPGPVSPKLAQTPLSPVSPTLPSGIKQRCLSSPQTSFGLSVQLTGSLGLHQATVQHKSCQSCMPFCDTFAWLCAAQAAAGLPVWRKI